MNSMKWIAAILLLVGQVSAQTASFRAGGSDTEIDIVNEDVAGYEDASNSGAHLFKVDANVDYQLSLAIKASDYYGSGYTHFRAMPQFMRCVQSVITYYANLETGAKQVLLVSGYKKPADNGGNAYASSGAFATLKFQDNSAAADLASAGLALCPKFLQITGGYLGYDVSGSNCDLFLVPAHDTADFPISAAIATKMNAIANDQSVAGKRLKCDSFSSLAANSYFPDRPTADAAVGGLDIPIVRGSDEFPNLLQYMGTNGITFAKQAGSPSWCGTPSYPCNDCSGGGIKGHAVKNRCTERLMSRRMAFMLRRLNREMVGEGSAFTVDSGYVEATSENEDPGREIDREGRLLVLSGDAAKLTKFAQCVGFDWVFNDNGNVVVAVKKQAFLAPNEVEFPRVSLPPVKIPNNETMFYTVDDEAIDLQDYPLFDGHGQQGQDLGDYSTFSTFWSEDTDQRYCRLTPKLVQCYDAMMSGENKWLQEGDSVEIGVKRACANRFVESDIDVDHGKRFDAYSTGVAFDIAYDNKLVEDVDPLNENYTMVRLAKQAARRCGGIAQQNGDFRMCIGFYSDFVFIDLECDEFTVWYHDQTVLGDADPAAVSDALEVEATASIDGRVIDPTDIQDACNEFVPPSRQSPEFVFEHKAEVKRRRRKREADICVATNTNRHCTESATRLTEMSDYFWHYAGQKHVYGPEGATVRLQDTCKACMTTCGTCASGDIWENKLQYCTECVKWANFKMHNDLNAFVDQSSLHVLTNDDTDAHACYDGRHCLRLAPAWNILGEIAEDTFRPDPSRSEIWKTFDEAQNPSPLANVLCETYTMHARGVFNIYVENDEEITKLAACMEAGMTHNSNITRVDVWVLQEETVPAVQAMIGTYVGQWTQSQCPLTSRPHVAPFYVAALPEESRRRRSLRGRDIGLEMRQARRNYDVNWAKRLEN